MPVWRALLVLSAVFVLWAAWVAITGGVTVPVSSHDPVRPLLLAAIVGAAYIAAYRQYWRSDLEALVHAPWPRVVVVLAVSAAFLVGIEQATFIAGGPDVSGYVSQADRWVRGELTSPMPEWVRDAPWAGAAVSAAPVGYTPDPSSSRLVPMYSPGLPLMMAGFERVGGADAVFYVVPVFGALTIWITYALGRMMAGPWAGAVAALLMLVSPPFLWMLVEPMSDVPAAACWSAAVLFACRPRWRDAVIAGLASAAAILVRPNTVPLAIVPALLLLSRSDARIRRSIAFALAVVPSALVIATLNARWHGSALKSGYGSLEMLYSMSNLLPNIRLYGGWFIATQTPLALLWLAAPYVLRKRGADRQRLLFVSIVYPAAVFAMYATYLTWPDWPYLRFLLPAFPAICASLAAVFVAFTREVRPRRLALAGVIAVTASICIQQLRFTSDTGFLQHRVDQRYARAVDFANSLPMNAILLSRGYSGTLRFYTGRDVLRWEALSPDRIDKALVYLRDRGHPLYFIGDPSEEDDFKSSFANTDAARRFDTERIGDVSYGFVAANLTPR
jgi:hypothetical protein